MMFVERNKFVDLEIYRKDGRYYVDGHSFTTRHCAEVFRRVCYLDQPGNSLAELVSASAESHRLAASGSFTVIDLFETKLLAARTEVIKRSVRSILLAKTRKAVQNLFLPKHIQTRFVVDKNKSSFLHGCATTDGFAELLCIVYVLVYGFLILSWAADKSMLVAPAIPLICAAMLNSKMFNEFFSVEEI